MIKKLWSYTGQYKKYAIATPLTMIGEVIFEVLIPFVMAAIIDNGVMGDGGMPYILWMGALMVVMALCSLTLGALGGKFGSQASMGFGANLRAALFDNVQDFSFANVDKFSDASLITRLTTDVTNTQMAFMMCIRMAFRAPVMFIGALIMAIIVDAELSMIFLVAVPVLGVFVFLLMSKSFPRFKALLTKYDNMNADVQENLTGIRVVKAYVREDHEDDKFQKQAEELRRAQVFAQKLLVLGMPVMMIVMFACIVAVVWLGGNRVIAGNMAVGELSSFVSYITQILMSLMMISMVFIMLVLSRASAARIVEVLDEKSSITDEAADPSLTPSNSGIAFKNVSFSYAGDPGNLTLTDIDFEIKPGETIGILGGTGSAKSTLVQLIPRLYDVYSGSVEVGGHDVRDYKLATLRDSVAMVLQKNVLFSGTIRDNLRWGDQNATDEQIIAACKCACADDFITAFPDGYDTVLGQGGVNLSGGQKQRLCIARALLKKPRIIILDDSTSAVDTATDAKIRAALREQLVGTTTIIIAQRVASVEDADRVLILDEGRIAAFDTPAHLLEVNPIYKEVYESQRKGAM